jgi:peptidoglycan hydrolase-like protein with peptidoglycan-binding domain
MHWKRSGLAGLMLCVMMLITPAVSQAASWPTYRIGSSGTDVYTIQHLLMAHGISLAVDGSFGSQTDRAVRTFQARKGLVVDGIVGNNTWGALIITVRQGSTGHAVRGAQRQLNKYGYGLVVDGSFGPKTLSATRDFQSKRGLAVDGVIGPITWNALVSGSGGSGGYSLPVPRSALPRSEYDDPHHDYPAIDLPVRTGTPVYAAKGGTARRVNETRCGYGYTITASDGGSYTYCHLSRYVAGSGVQVATGALIGYSGNTGNSSGPHLHLQIRYGGALRCPQRMLLAIYDGAAVPPPSSLPTSGCFY